MTYTEKAPKKRQFAWNSPQIALICDETCQAVEVQPLLLQVERQ